MFETTTYQVSLNTDFLKRKGVHSLKPTNSPWKLVVWEMNCHWKMVGKWYDLHPSSLTVRFWKVTATFRERIVFQAWIFRWFFAFGSCPKYWSTKWIPWRWIFRPVFAHCEPEFGQAPQKMVIFHFANRFPTNQSLKAGIEPIELAGAKHP